jgi:O-antigen ligase
MDNNSYAIALVTGIGFAFFLGLYERAWWRRLVAFGAAAFMAHAVFFSFSRGGMLALIVTGVVSFLVIEKRPKQYAWFAIGLVLALSMAGEAVRNRFASAFLDEEERDYSATSRIELWRDCLDVMIKNPLFGAGPDHWPLIAPHYGWPRGKEAHSVWFQQGAELGFVGVGLLAAYFLLSVRQLWLLSRKMRALEDGWPSTLARAVVASTAGYLVASQFVSLEGLEIPYYVVMCGLAGLVVESRAAAEAVVQAAPPPFVRFSGDAS